MNAIDSTVILLRAEARSRDSNKSVAIVKFSTGEIDVTTAVSTLAKGDVILDRVDVSKYMDKSDDELKSWLREIGVA